MNSRIDEYYVYGLNMNINFKDAVKSVLRIHSAQAYIPMVGTRLSALPL